MAGHPSQEQLGPPTLKVDGFQLWVHGREFPESQDHDDGNWLRVTAHCGRAGASVWAAGSILQVMDVVRWANECEAVGRGSRKGASLEPLEQELKVEIRATDSLGHLEMRVEITPDHIRQEHVFIFEIDQSYIPTIVKQCREIEKSYPIRGGTAKRGVQ